MAELRRLTVRHADGLRTPTVIPRLTIWFSPHRTDPTPAMFEPKVYILLQGAKRLTIGSRSVEYAAGSCSVSSVGLPFTGQVIEASRAAPYLGIELRFDVAILAGLLLEMPQDHERDVPVINVARAAADIIEPMYRLMRLLDSPGDVPILAPLIERELYYRLLHGPLAATLRQVVEVNGHVGKIRRAVEWIGNHAAATLSIRLLAETAGMSVTSLHRHFKAVTALSPLAYQKQVRLLEARRILTSAGGNVTAAAFAVGYASSSQFSREYTRLFGVTPRCDIMRCRDADRVAGRRRPEAAATVEERSV